MADYDGVSGCKDVVIQSPAVMTTDNTQKALDTLGFRAATIATNIGAGGVTFTAARKIEIKLSHGDSETVGDAEAVKAEHVIMPPGEKLGSSGIIRAFIAAKTADANEHLVGYIGKKRYLFLSIDFTGSHGTGTPIAASLKLAHAVNQPVEQSKFEAATTPY